MLPLERLTGLERDDFAALGRDGPWFLRESDQTLIPRQAIELGTEAGGEILQSIDPVCARMRFEDFGENGWKDWR